LVAAWERWRGKKIGAALALVSIWGAGVACYFLWSVFMNRTHAQGAVTAHVWENVRAARALELAGVGALVFFGAAGLATWVGRTKFRLAPWWAWCAMAVLVGWLGWGVEWHDRIYFEHGRYAGDGQWYLRALLAVAALGWLTHRVELRWLHCGGGLASLVLICLRRDVWDYYFIDLFVFGFLAAKVAEPDGDERPVRLVWVRRVAWMAAASALIWWHGLFVMAFKVETDVRWAAVALTEKALRAGALQVEEIRALPFGYVAWQLFPASLRRRPDGGTDSDNFFDYLCEPSAEVELVAAEGRSRRYVGARDSRPREVLAQGEFPLVGEKAKFELVRFSSETRTPAKRALPAGFSRPVFPLDDAEWSAAIRRLR